jgi:anaerobic selenocysteine-containing dehydrogenase
MAVETKHHVCRVCHAACNLVVELDDGKVRSIRGDKHDPIFFGYSCIKGRESATLHALPSRLLRTVKRQADGSHAPIDSAAAAAEVAQQLQRIVAQHGPRSVALYIGTYGYGAFANNATAQALMKAIGSPMVFTSVTIDQPGKGIAMAMHGPWLAGTPPMQSWDALLLVGTNPIISMNGGLGVNPARMLKQAKYRGLKLVVVDPRKSECARQADVFLQCRPGEDAAVLAGIARLLLEENLLDAPFVAAETQGIAALREAVAAFTPDYVAARAGIRVEDLIAGARLLGNARRGAVSAGTGANMSGQGNIVEYLVKVITSLRGWWLRAGEVKQNPGVLIECFPPIAASPGPFPAVDFGEKMRIRGLTECAAGLPTAALADEILLPGEGQIKALIVLGGNPMLAWPDQVKTQAAMRALDLLVCFDPRLNGTGRHAHYVFAPKLSLEIESNTSANELYSNFGPGWGFEHPYAQVSAPVLQPPPESDVHEEWEILFDIARHMGLQLAIKPFSVLDPVRAAQMATPMDMSRKPDVAEMWRMVLKGAPVDYDLVRAQDNGRVYERPTTLVQEKPAGWSGSLQIGAAPMMQELMRIAAHPPQSTHESEFPLRLISRRLNDVVNSSGHDNPRQQRKWAYNPAFMNPADLQAVGAQAGDVLEISSADGSILGIAEPSPEVRCGCVSMSHAWGKNPGEEERPQRDGGNTGRLLSTDRGFDVYTGIPLMSSVPVRVRLALP